MRETITKAQRGELVAIGRQVAALKADLDGLQRKAMAVVGETLWHGPTEDFIVESLADGDIELDVEALLTELGVRVEG